MKPLTIEIDHLSLMKLNLFRSSCFISTKIDTIAMNYLWDITFEIPIIDLIQ